MQCDEQDGTTLNADAKQLPDKHISADAIQIHFLNLAPRFRRMGQYVVSTRLFGYR